MLKHFLAAAAFAVCFIPHASAQEALLPVEEMNCDQMTAEMMVAGQQMNSQLDPEFAREAQAMQQEAQAGQQRPSIAAGVGMGIACSIPGIGMACMTAQQAQAANAARDAEQNQARMDAQVDRLNSSMAGLDQNRLMAMSDRYEAMRCQAPQQ